MPPDHRAVLGDSLLLEAEDVLRGDHVTLHAHHLADVGDPAGTVREAAHVNQELESGGHLLADGAFRDLEAGEA